MMQRCFNPKDVAFQYYGGRGVSVDPTLRTFQGFLAVLGPRPEDMSLERINSDGDYTPSNVKWATIMEQNNNRRSNVQITYKGKSQTLAAWARDLGMNKTMLWNRLNTYKWSVADSFERPKGITCYKGLTTRKLSDEQVLEIARSTELQRVVAEKFGVCQTLVSQIRAGKCWGTLTGLKRS